MMQIPRGEYWIGSRISSRTDEQPRHKVHIDKPNYLGQVPVTVGLWQAVDRGYLHAFDFGAPKSLLPKVEVRWNDVVGEPKQVGWLQKLTSLVPPQPNYQWCLPTESKWEVGCRASTLSEYWSGEDDASLADIAWYNKNSESKIRLVTEFPSQKAKEHPLGLLRMHGLVEEWCADVGYSKAYLTKSPLNNGFQTFIDVDMLHVFRGGSWRGGCEECRSSFRAADLLGGLYGNRGFRLCLSPPPPHANKP
jgi:formylglycine-generating enzyme required for sulfatase activity